MSSKRKSSKRKSSKRKSIKRKSGKNIGKILRIKKNKNLQKSFKGNFLKNQISNKILKKHTENKIKTINKTMISPKKLKKKSINNKKKTVKSIKNKKIKLLQNLGKNKIHSKKRSSKKRRSKGKKSFFVLHQPKSISNEQNLTLDSIPATVSIDQTLLESLLFNCIFYNKFEKFGKFYPLLDNIYCVFNPNKHYIVTPKFNTPMSNWGVYLRTPYLDYSSLILFAIYCSNFKFAMFILMANHINTNQLMNQERNNPWLKSKKKITVLEELLLLYAIKFWNSKRPSYLMIEENEVNTQEMNSNTDKHLSKLLYLISLKYNTKFYGKTIDKLLHDLLLYRAIHVHPPSFIKILKQNNMIEKQLNFVKENEEILKLFYNDCANSRGDNLVNSILIEVYEFDEFLVFDTLINHFLIKEKTINEIHPEFYNALINDTYIYLFKKESTKSFTSKDKLYLCFKKIQNDFNKSDNKNRINSRVKLISNKV